MSKILLGHNLSASQRSRFKSLESYVFGPLHIKGADVSTARNMINLVNDVFEAGIVYTGDFGKAIDEMWVFMEGLSKSKRKKLRIKNLSKVFYPMKGTMSSRRRAQIDRMSYYSEEGKAARLLRDRSLLEEVRKNSGGQNHGVGKTKGSNDFPCREAKEEFYKSWEWRTLRMEAIQKHGRACQCCGAGPGQRYASGEPVRICVDHIKPISKHWHLRLDLSNLQILCDECNQGKGNWSETDFRPAPVADEWVLDDVGVSDAILSQLTDRTTGRLQ